MPYHTEGNNDQYHQISSLHSNFQFSLQCQNSEFICFLTQDPVRPTCGSRLFGLRWFQTYGLASISFLEEVRRAWVWVGQAQLTMSRGGRHSEESPRRGRCGRRYEQCLWPSGFQVTLAVSSCPGDAGRDDARPERGPVWSLTMANPLPTSSTLHCVTG